MGWGSEWKCGEDYIENYSKAIAINFIDDMQYGGNSDRDKFLNGEVKYYHWFINQDEEGKHLCIYKYYALDSEDKCLKIPLSILKDKLKPEYKVCYYTKKK